MFRRAKVPLSSIREELVDAASGIPGGYLAAQVDGTARDGGPACGSVPLRGGGWVLADGDAVG